MSEKWLSIGKVCRQSRTSFKPASLASAARSCLQRRVSGGTRRLSDTPFSTSGDSQTSHHVLFRTHGSKRLSLPGPSAENGSATEASENGKSVSSRKLRSKSFPEKGTSSAAGASAYPYAASRKSPASGELYKKGLEMRGRTVEMGGTRAYGKGKTVTYDRPLLHRIDPAKLLRASYTKSLYDNQTLQTRLTEVHRPIVCEEGSSACYFWRKGGTFDALGNWPPGDAGSTKITRRLACMLVRQMQKEIQHGFYPVCRPAALMWVSLVGSILFLLVGTWFTVENERHVECRLNYEDETLQEGGSRYSLLSITADVCSGRLHVVPSDRAVEKEQSFYQSSGRRGPLSTTPNDGSGRLMGTGGLSKMRRSRSRLNPNSYAGRESQFEGPFPDKLRNGSVRSKVPRSRTPAYSGASSAPLTSFFGLSAPMPLLSPETEDDGSHVLSVLNGPYIYVYIEMERFNQNDAQIVWSRKDEQLAGKVFTDPSDLKECEPAVTAVVNNTTKVLHPCGVLAWNVFTDRFQFLDAVPDDSSGSGPVRPLVVEQNEDLLLGSFGDWRKRFKNPPPEVRAQYRDRVYFWMSFQDNDDGKDMYKTPEEAKAELLMDRLNYEEAGEMVENGHFIQWMHAASFSTWRKLYGRIRGPIKLPVFAYVAVTYDVKQWRGKKAIVLVQPSRFYGRSQFVGISYLVFGCILAVVAGYMMWRKWFYLTKEDAIDRALDLRWRTHGTRREKKR